MKFTKYITILSLLFFASCTTELLEQPSFTNNEGDMIKLVSRVIPFSDCDVATRANKNNDEVYISSIDYFIFGNDNKCRFHQRVTSTEPLSIDRSSDELDDLTNCFIVSIANTAGFSTTIGSTTYDQIVGQSFNVSGVTIPQNVGLVMIGRTDVDDLSTLPSGDILTIPMESLFSKIVFNITVDSNAILPGEDSPIPTFVLNGCTVHNVASTVDFLGGTESDEGSNNGTNDPTAVISDSFEIDAYGTTIDGGLGISFSFYLPERFLHAGTPAKDFIYPFTGNHDQNIDPDGDGLRDEDKRYRQHYKPLLAKGYEGYDSTESKNGDRNATYATITGVYSDHQGHSYEVSYDIYVGNDNYSNFDIVRNTQYNNNIVIQGINNSKDQSTNMASVSIDHRVNVDRIAPVIINLRRETQLDSHYEVRPLRIRTISNASESNISHALVEIEYLHGENGTNNNPYWIGLEHKTNNANNSTDHLSSGKRKYFTTNLVTSTLAGANTNYSDNKGQKVVVPISATDECVWIYVDECLSAGDNVRDAIIRVTCGTLNGSKFTPNSDYKPVEYRLNQRYLFEVTYNDHTYLIEYEEEYLHNFDSNDNYGQTYDEGMPWGLNDEQLSKEHASAYVSESGVLDRIINALANNDAIKYDFYLTTDVDIQKGTKHDYFGIGQTFTSEIISTAKIPYLELNQQPTSAIQYCYSRNKIDNNGTISNKWYMPSITEIEEIMKGEYRKNGSEDIEKAYVRFDDFQNKPYWSCQPAYTRNYLDYKIWGVRADGWFYMDDTDRARATQVSYSGTYSTIPSGVQSGKFTNTLYIRNLDGISPVISMKQTTQRDKEGLYYEGEDETFYQAGNLSRDRKARVRCVRKMD